jgi:hypothetical protein
MACHPRNLAAEGFNSSCGPFLGTWTTLLVPGGGDRMTKIWQYLIFSAVMDISES